MNMICLNLHFNMLFLVTGSPTTIGPQTTTTNPNTVVPTVGSTGKTQFDN